ncbi:hypothetical protein HY087_00350, partial [Candidatus Gottesmanbacteria bacterium]|nr:hypothetical protein [Candidatus Gottesmanbacteria bacterium]
MHIVFIFNVRHTKPALDQTAQDEAEFDEPETIKNIHDAIIANGYECTDIEADENAYGKLQRLKANVDLVFNIAEGLYHGLPTPRFVEIGLKEKPFVEGLTFPVIVKPNSEGSSKGVFNDSLVEKPDALLKKIRDTRKAYGNGVIVEEYMPGREFTVAVMGNAGVGKGVYILPIVEQNFDIFPETMKKFASYEAKWFFEDTLADPRTAYVC